MSTANRGNMFDQVFLTNLFCDHNDAVLTKLQDDNGEITIYFVNRAAVYKVIGQYIEVQGNKELFVNTPVRLTADQIADLVVDGTIKGRCYGK